MLLEDSHVVGERLVALRLVPQRADNHLRRNAAEIGMAVALGQHSGRTVIRLEQAGLAGDGRETALEGFHDRQADVAADLHKHTHHLREKPECSAYAWCWRCSWCRRSCC